MALLPSPTKDDEIYVQRGEMMFSRLRDESVTEQEIKPSSRGSTDTAQLCKHCSTYHSITNAERLVAVPA